MEQARNPNLLGLLGVTVTSFVLIVYSIIVMTTGNWVWFLANAELSDPVRIVIIDHGDSTVITPEDIRFEALATAVSNSVSDISNNSLVSVGLSDLTLEQYKTDAVVMEVHYPLPITFNTPFRAGNPTEILIPLEGRHAGTGLFFRGNRGTWWFGGMRMTDPTPLYTALSEIGYHATVRGDNENSS